MKLDGFVSEYVINLPRLHEILPAFLKSIWLYFQAAVQNYLPLLAPSH